jgi:TatD DNase family protein
MSSPVIDTHVHYNLDPLHQEWQTHWQKATQHQINGGVVVGTNLKTSQTALEIAQTQPQLKAAIGIHPCEAQKIEFTPALTKLKQLAQQPQVIAIGEIGLDYFRLDRSDQDKFHQTIATQKKIFIAQLQIALENNLPVSIHTRDRKLKPKPTHDNAYWDTLRTLKDHFLNQENHPDFILHCVSGPENYIQEAQKLGAYFGVDGNITYKNAQDLRNIISSLPPQKILVETDAPYLPPIPHRGKTCEPWMVALTAEYLETEMGISRKQLLENTKRIFPEFNQQ